MTDTPMWQPSRERIANSTMKRFMHEVAERWDIAAQTYPSLHRWSVEQPEDFWLTVWDFCGVIAKRRGDAIVRDREKMPGACWFPEARLNFAERICCAGAITARLSSSGAKTR